MAYKLFEEGQELTNRQTLLNSFWFQCEFNANSHDGVVEITNGWFAVYLSWLPGKNIPDEPVFAGAEGDTKNYKIEDSSGGSFEIKQAQLQQAIKLRRCNERGKLFLFQLVDNIEGKREWLDPANWIRVDQTPDRNENNAKFASDKITFGDVADKHIHELVGVHSNTGLNGLGIALQFMQQSVFKEIIDLANVGQTKIPSITLKLDTGGVPQESSYFVNTPLSGTLNGYVMVAQGAFKAIDADAALSGQWFTDNKAPALAQRLVGVLSNAMGLSDKQSNRTLENIDETAFDGNMGPSGDEPVEVLFLKGMKEAPLP